MFSYTPVFTVSLVLEKKEIEREPNHQQIFPPCRVLPLPSVRRIRLLLCPRRCVTINYRCGLHYLEVAFYTKIFGIGRSLGLGSQGSGLGMGFFCLRYFS